MSVQHDILGKRWANRVFDVARRIRDSLIDSREARRKLAVRGKPYWRSVERGLHLGYRRRSDGAGRWIARHYLGSGKYEEEAIGSADDLSDADGVAILDYWQAVDASRERLKARAHRDAGKTGPYKVSDAVADYLEFLHHNRASAYDVRRRMTIHVLPDLGDIEVSQLTAKRIRRWHSDLAKKPARLRSRPGAKQNYRKDSDDPDVVRGRKASANRCLFQLKAALNRAWREEKVESDAAWRKVQPFENVDAARVRYLTVAESTRLLNACPPDFRLLVRAALETGARYGELCRLTVSDYNPDTGTVSIRTSKTGKARHIVLTEDGQEFFKQVCMGRPGEDVMLLRDDRTPWLKSHQVRRIRDACDHANINPPINFHGLRHTWASLAVMNNVPLFVVARNLGHSDTRMVEKHYGHMAPGYIAEAIRAGAPRFGQVEPSNVEPLPQNGR